MLKASTTIGEGFSTVLVSSCGKNIFLEATSALCDDGTCAPPLTLWSHAEMHTPKIPSAGDFVCLLIGIIEVASLPRAPSSIASRRMRTNR